MGLYAIIFANLDPLVVLMHGMRPMRVELSFTGTLQDCRALVSLARGRLGNAIGGSIRAVGQRFCRILGGDVAGKGRSPPKRGESEREREINTERQRERERERERESTIQSASDSTGYRIVTWKKKA